MSDDAEFARHEQIWTAMYGPARAQEALAVARARRAEHPTADLRELLRGAEPSDDYDDPDEAGTMRPGVG